MLMAKSVRIGVLHIGPTGPVGKQETINQSLIPSQVEMLHLLGISSEYLPDKIVYPSHFRVPAPLKPGRFGLFID